MVKDFVSLPFRSTKRPPWYRPLGYGVAVLGMAGATAILWLAQPIVNLGTVNLVYLLIVVAVAVGWGLGQGIFTSVLAFLTANFFFTEPRFTFTVASFQDVLALVVLLAMAILTSQLVAGLRREAEEARRGQQAAVQAEILRRTDALRVALLSAVAHDLRTPLATIKTGTTNLLNPRMVWSDEDTRAFLQIISSQVDHIDHLVSSLLDMSRIEQGRLHLNEEPHQIKDVIETVIERLQPSLLAHPVDTKYDPDIPPVPMDVMEIDEVLTNLLENAAKYTPPGTPIHISAHATSSFLPNRQEQLRAAPDTLRSTEFITPSYSPNRQEQLRAAPDTVRSTEFIVAAPPDSCNGFVEVRVADEGPGIPRESLPYLFQRFYRVTAGKPGSAASAEGTGGGVDSIGARGWGLGLAIVKGIIEAHGGQVSVANEPGGGAVFTFTLPMQLHEQQSAIQ